MKVDILKVLLLTLSNVDAIKFSQKVSHTTLVQHQKIHDVGNEKGSQTVLSEAGRGKFSATSRGLPVAKDFWGIYTTNISLGTPSQSFRAVVDIGATDMFVPSINCGGSRCNGKVKYDHLASSTYVENGTIKQIDYLATMAWGKETVDTLSLGSGLQVPNQHFVALNYYQSIYPDTEVQYFDSVLGLSYDEPWSNSIPYVTPSTLQSPFGNMVDSGSLDSNMFSLLLPTEERDGDITFGGYNHDLVAEGFTRHALFPPNTSKWQIEADAVTMYGKDAGGKDVTLVNESLSGLTAIVMTAYPILGFPTRIGEAMREHLNITYNYCANSEVVSCDDVPHFPIIKLKLGGHDYELSGEDYVMEFERQECLDAGPLCTAMIEGIPANVDLDDLPEDFIVIGSSFLKTYYGVFDWDDKTIGFGKPKERHAYAKNNDLVKQFKQNLT